MRRTARCLSARILISFVRISSGTSGIAPELQLPGGASLVERSDHPLAMTPACWD
jgi:hypothetical protein